MSRLTALKAAALVRDAGGRVVGRTRLQKIAYLLTATGLESGVSFSYKHYGPYSEELANATREADLMGLISETEQQASWGGTYSTYTLQKNLGQDAVPVRQELAALAASADAIELELAATALFLAKEGHSSPWAETARRKPEKASGGRLEKAQALYGQLSKVKTPSAWPRID